MKGGEEVPRHAMQRDADRLTKLWCWPFHLLPGVSEALRHVQFEQAYALFQASRRMLGAPEFGIETVRRQGGESVPVTVTTVAHTPFCRLLRFAAGSGTDVVARPKLLLCAPQAGHYVALMRDAVRSLLDDSDVYVTEWIDARDIPPEAGALSLEDHVLTLERFMASLEPATLDVLAICQATVPALVAGGRLAARGEQQLRSLVLMGGPIDARCHPTSLGRTARGLSAEWFAQRCTGLVPRGYPGAGRRVYPGFLQLSSLAGDPSRQVGAFLEAVLSVSRGDSQGVAASVLDAADFSVPLDLPAEFVEDTTDVVFRRFLLPNGKWYIDGARVRLDSMRDTHLLTIEGADDTITGAGQTHAAHLLCTRLPSSYRERITVSQCDHYGLFRGKAWYAQVYPLLRRRLAAWRATADHDSIA